VDASNVAMAAKGEKAVSLGPTELILILVIVLVLFGAGKLPQVFGSLGRGIKEFREASEGKEEPTVPPATGSAPVVTNPPAETPVSEVPVSQETPSTRR
jgi:sec-independent protein translocase protein TatA